jgi:undecaprenyl-diphosphatase
LSMLLPGLSRSAATIIGGLTQGLNREKAAEFAFFLAVPTMAAASAKSGLEYYKDVKKGILPALTQHDMVILAIGNLVAFVVAMIAIKTFIGFLNQNGFKMFGYYRIIIGLLILGLQFAGVQLFL